MKQTAVDGSMRPFIADFAGCQATGEKKNGHDFDSRKSGKELGTFSRNRDSYVVIKGGGK